MRNTTIALIAGVLLLAPAVPGYAGSCSKANRQVAMDADIVDVAASAGSFDTLVAAVTAAELVDTLKGEGPFTVFAPTDEAFAKLPEGTVETLLRPENRDQLVAVLTYHVVPGRLPASEVVRADGLETVNGQRARIRAAADRVQIDNATIIRTDIETSNGIIHVIDEVILPGPARNAREDAREVIEYAIATGAPLYNDDQVRACTAIYRTAALGLIGQEALSGSEKDRLSHALDRVERSNDAREQAWILRRGLDDVYASLHHDAAMDTMASVSN